MTRKEEQRRAVKTSRGGGTALGKVSPPTEGSLRSALKHMNCFLPEGENQTITASIPAIRAEWHAIISQYATGPVPASHVDGESPT